MLFKNNVSLNIRENKEIKCLITVANDINSLLKSVLGSKTVGEDMEIIFAEIKTLRASLTDLLAQSRSDRKALTGLICQIVETALCKHKQAYIIHFQNDIIRAAS